MHSMLAISTKISVLLMTAFILQGHILMHNHILDPLTLPNTLT